MVVSKIKSYLKNYRIGFVPVLISYFAFMSVLYSFKVENEELLQLTKDINSSSVLGNSSPYILLKELSCSTDINSKDKAKILSSLSVYEFKIKSFLKKHQISDEKAKFVNDTLKYISSTCKIET